MFKFDFDFDGANDLEEIFPTPKIQPVPSDKPSLELEPFAENFIDVSTSSNLPLATI
jgi:hypothetical protein